MVKALTSMVPCTETNKRLPKHSSAIGDVTGGLSSSLVHGWKTQRKMEEPEQHEILDSDVTMTLTSQAIEGSS